MSIKKIFSAATLICTAAAAIASAQDVDPCTQKTALTGGQALTIASGSDQAMGNLAGTPFHYEMWFNKGQNSNPNVTMHWYGADKGGGGAFKATWNNSGTINYLARVGYYWGGQNTKTHKDYNQIYCDFSFTKSGTGGGWSYFGIYGWTIRPTGSGASNYDLVEYYIVEDWLTQGQLGPSTVCGGCSSKGTVTSDGGTYNIYTNVQNNQPSIQGNKTFLQIFSVRQGSRQCGTIHISKHFEEWEKLLNIDLGGLYEVKFKAETGGGNGSFDAHYLKFSQETVPRGSVTPGNFSLVTTASPTAAGEVARNTTPTGGYAPGTSVTLTATAKSGWKFAKWEGDHTGTANPANITMDANKNITAVFEPTSDNTTNLIKDGNFPANSVGSNNDGRSWVVGQGEHWGNSQASSSISNGSVTVNISSTGTQAYQPQLVQYGVSLTKGMNYRLTFTARAAAARDIEVSFQQASDPWATYHAEDISLTTTDKEYTVEFKMEDESDNGAQFAFNLGQSTQNVIISDVKLVYIAGNTSIAARPAVSPAATSPNIKVTAGKAGINVKFKAANSGATELKLYSLKGDLVAKTSLRTAAGKSYRHTFSPGKLANGFYVVSVSSSGAVERSRVIMPK